MCVCVQLCPKSEGRVMFGKKGAVLTDGDLLKLIDCVRGVCVLVCEDTASAYNTRHYRSVSVLCEWVCSLSLRQR